MESNCGKQNANPQIHIYIYSLSFTQLHLNTALLWRLKSRAFGSQTFSNTVPHTSLGHSAQSDAYQADEEVRLVPRRHLAAGRRSIHIGGLTAFPVTYMVYYTMSDFPLTDRGGSRESLHGGWRRNRN